ncbi:hypothetical protein [Spirosoma telluris]|uniref:hypothetical protein n=1 Tax=Spirosoma telluris TaxID=2183553 RepID=UPI0013143409
MNEDDIEGKPILSDAYKWIQNGESVETNKMSFEERMKDALVTQRALAKVAL